MVSTRYVPHIAVLALLTCVVVFGAWLAPRRADPCARPDVLPVTSLIPGSRPEGERRDRLGGEVIQWSEGRITADDLPRDPPVLFRIIRTYNVLKSAERPLSLLPASLEPEQVRVESLEAPGGPLPVHVVRTTGPHRFYVAAYLYLYGNEPVSHPFVSQVRNAVRELREGQRPLTLFLVGGPANRENAAAREEIALRWIGAAWQNYRTLCLAGGPGQP